MPEKFIREPRLVVEDPIVKGVLCHRFTRFEQYGDAKERKERGPECRICGTSLYAIQSIDPKFVIHIERNDGNHPIITQHFQLQGIAEIVRMSNVVKHHVSYDPEQTLFLCKSCHGMVHSREGWHDELEPDMSREEFEEMLENEEE